MAVSSADEPESALRLQLELLHAHFLAILTDNFDRMLARNPRFEPRRLLGARLPWMPQRHSAEGPWFSFISVRICRPMHL